jgi:predicted amidohydrolase
MAEITLATANVQLTHSKEANVKKFFDMIDTAADRGARLIVFPECALQGYLFGIGHSFGKDEWEYHYANAETVPGPSTERFIEKAKQHDMVIVYGITEKIQAYGSAVLADSAVTVSPRGLHGVYRKVHCGVGEKIAFQPGNSWPVYDTHIGRIGTLICYDVIFPEAARELVLQGAEILAFPTVWPASNLEGYEEQDLGSNHDLFCRARALENQVFFVSSNACATDDVSDMRFYGHSQIVAPTGQVLAIAGYEEKLLTATVDIQLEITKARTIGFNGLYFCKDRRPETYRQVNETSFPYTSFAAAPSPH